MALRKNSDGNFDLRLYVHPENPKIFLYEQLLSDYDYEAYKEASERDKKKIEIFLNKYASATIKIKCSILVQSHMKREEEEKAAQTMPSSDPVEQLASTVEKLSLGSEAKYTDEDAERFLALSGKPGAISSLSNDDQQKYVYWKIDYLQPFIAQQTEERQRLETERVELDRRRDFLLRQTAEKILDELAEKNQTTSSVVNSGPTKKSSVTY